MTKYKISIADWSKDSAALTAIRTEVFVEEQQVPIELEMDDMDSQSLHLKASLEDGQVIATARLLPNHYIGRMCVSKSYRRLGIGGEMLELFIQHAKEQDIESLHLNAQVNALPFYAQYGFAVDSEAFFEAGILHKHMTLKL